MVLSVSVTTHPSPLSHSVCDHSQTPASVSDTVITHSVWFLWAGDHWSPTRSLLSLSLSLTHTHTHTHTLSFLSVSLSGTSLFLSTCHLSRLAFLSRRASLRALAPVLVRHLTSLSRFLSVAGQPAFTDYYTTNQSTLADIEYTTHMWIKTFV